MAEILPLKLVDLGSGQGELAEFEPGDTLPLEIVAGLEDALTSKQDTLVPGANITIDPVTNEISAEGGGAPYFLPVAVSSTTTATLGLDDAGVFYVTTSATAKTRTVPPSSSVAWEADTEVHFLNDSVTNLTIEAGAGVTLVAPAGGSLIVPPRGTVTLKRIGADRWAVIGTTVAA